MLDGRRDMHSSLLRRSIGLWLMVIGFGLLGMVLVTSGAAQTTIAQEPPSATPPVSPIDTSQPPQSCAECHLDVTTEWQNGSHARAYDNRAFQRAWQANQNVMCLECHTTGFTPRTGEFQQKGVACEACHGNTPVNHPPEPIVLDPGPEICLDCHTNAYDEWRRSAHGEQQIACSDCHHPHPESLHFEATNGLCTSCHTEIEQHFAHESHQTQTCTACHWYADRAEDTHVLTGVLLTSGHDGIVDTQACSNCHANLSDEELAVEISAAGEENPLLETRLQIDEVESELGTVKTQSENTEAVRVIQGLIAGMAVGAVFAFVMTRVNGNKKKESAAPAGENDQTAGTGGQHHE